jgi:hypothetical protein
MRLSSTNFIVSFKYVSFPYFFPFFFFFMYRKYCKLHSAQQPKREKRGRENREKRIERKDFANNELVRFPSECRTLLFRSISFFFFSFFFRGRRGSMFFGVQVHVLEVFNSAARTLLFRLSTLLSPFPCVLPFFLFSLFL